MSWLFSQALVGEFSEAISLDGAQSALWNGTPMQLPSWCTDRTMAACRFSRSGMTFRPLTDDLGEAVLMSYLEAFPARTSAPPEKEWESKGSGAVCGATWQELLVKFDRDTSSWRTHHCLWDEVLPESSLTLPKWGMLQNGELWERITLPDALTSGTGSGFLATPTATANQLCPSMMKHSGCRAWWPTPRGMWPTPSARDWKGASDPEKRKAAGRQVGLNDQVKMWPTPTAAEAGKISNRANYGQKGLSNHPAIVGEPTRPKEKKSRKGEKNWPTPVARDYKGPQPTVRKNGQPRATHLPNAVEEEPSNGQLNPTWVEAYLMGWPVAWTSMEPMPPEVFHEWERTFLTGPIDSSA